MTHVSTWVLDILRLSALVCVEKARVESKRRVLLSHRGGARAFPLLLKPRFESPVRFLSTTGFVIPGSDTSVRRDAIVVAVCRIARSTLINNFHENRSQPRSLRMFRPCGEKVRGQGNAFFSRFVNHSGRPIKDRQCVELDEILYRGKDHTLR